MFQQGDLVEEAVVDFRNDRRETHSGAVLREDG